METELRRKMLVQEYQSLVSLISAKGLNWDPLADKNIDDVSLDDLIVLVREAKVIARTPSE